MVGDPAGRIVDDLCVEPVRPGIGHREAERCGREVPRRRDVAGRLVAALDGVDLLFREGTRVDPRAVDLAVEARPERCLVSGGGTQRRDQQIGLRLRRRDIAHGMPARRVLHPMRRKRVRCRLDEPNGAACRIPARGDEGPAARRDREVGLQQERALPVAQPERGHAGLVDDEAVARTVRALGLADDPLLRTPRHGGVDPGRDGKAPARRQRRRMGDAQMGAGLHGLDTARICPVAGGDDLVFSVAGPFRAVIGLQKAHDVGSIGADLAVDLEGDRRALAHAPAVGIAIEFHRWSPSSVQPPRQAQEKGRAWRAAGARRGIRAATDFQIW